MELFNIVVEEHHSYGSKTKKDLADLLNGHTTEKFAKEKVKFKYFLMKKNFWINLLRVSLEGKSARF